jgi:lysophospholipase L1-like esterase
MALVFFFATMVVAGREVARRVWAGEASAGPCERAASTAVFALAVAIALSWTLAIPGVLTRGGLVVGAALVLACAVVAWWRRSRSTDHGRAPTAPEGALGRFVMAAGLVALACAGAFFLWRGTVVFLPNHDGASYHLPKAALLVRAHGYQTFDSPDVRLGTWPCDYELLLADAMLLDGSDAHAAWLSVVFWGFFLLAVAGMAERWWGRGAHVLASVLIAAAMPIVLLHADAYKNDVLTSALFLTSIAFGARWAVAGGRAACLTMATSVAAALGTKGSALFLVAALGPLVAWWCVRTWRARDLPTPADLARVCACAVALFLLLGGSVYVRNAIETGNPLGPHQYQSSYGDWGNLFRFTYLAFARPFSASDENVWVPWRRALWFWGRYDLFFSEWGMPSSVLLAAVPFGVARYARRALGPASGAERFAGSLAIVLAFALIVPIHLVPVGFFAAFIRYTIFLPVLVVLWTVAPALAELRATAWRALATGGLAAAVAVYFVREVENDPVEPLGYALTMSHHPEDRRFPSFPDIRACDVLDRFYAGPDDTVAFDGGFDSWSYACFGVARRRDIVYMRPRLGVPVAIPSAAKWVVIDRAWAITFGDPAFHDFGDWSTHLMRGSPTAEDLQTFEQLRSDPHFELVYRKDETNQAVFRRVEPRGLRYLALGDSFTAGFGVGRSESYPERLAQRWRSAGLGVDTSVLAVSGQTTSELAAQVAAAPPLDAPDVVTICIGTNDVVRGTQPNAVRVDVRAIFASLARQHVEPSRVWVLPIPDWSRLPAAGAFGPAEVLHARFDVVNALLREEAAAAGAHFVDLEPTMRKAMDDGLVGRDGIHPSGEAYALWTEAVGAAVEGAAGGSEAFRKGFSKTR